MAAMCPTCEVKLGSVRTAFGVGWLCPQCRGRAANLSVLRRAVRQPFMREVWRQTKEPLSAALAAEAPACPSCRHAMRTVVTEGESNAPVQLGICPSCQLAWMEAGEVESLPRLPQTEPVLNDKARELVAMAEVEARRGEAQREAQWAAPEEGWRALVTLLGFPAEENAPPILRRPWVTWLLAGGMVAVTLACLLAADPDAVVRDWGLRPDDLLRHGGLNWITSFFLHGGLWHLVGNAYFLLIFGDNVEDLLGRWRYLGLIVVAELGANALHLAATSGAGVPLVGASGGISGIIVFYALALPRVRLVFFLWLGLWSLWLTQTGRGWFRLSARWALAAWAALQVIGVWEQLAGFSHVSALAHLGGAAAGAAAWWRFRAQLTPVLETVDVSD